MKFFAADGPIYNFISRLWDLIKLNFLWLICSIFIIPFGPATVAACGVCLKMSEDKEGYIAKAYFDLFKKNLKKGIPLGLLFLIIVYSLYLDVQMFHVYEDISVYFLVAGLIAGFAGFLYFVYAFALMARYENTIIGTLKNSCKIATRYFLRTLILAFTLVVELLIIFWNYYTLMIGLIVGPATIIYTICIMVMRFFREIEKEPGSVSNPDDIDPIVDNH